MQPYLRERDRYICGSMSREIFLFVLTGVPPVLAAKRHTHSLAKSYQPILHRLDPNFYSSPFPYTDSLSDIIQKCVDLLSYLPLYAGMWRHMLCTPTESKPFPPGVRVSPPHLWCMN